MPRSERAQYHTEPKLEFTTGIPSDREGNDGDKRFCSIPDKGLYHFVKYQGKWMSSPVYEETLGKLTKNGLDTENVTSSHDIRLNPARNVEIKEKKDIGTGDFTAGFVSGAGWRLRHVDNEYNMEVDSMTVRGTLHVYEMLIQQLRATNGTVVVSSAAKTESATSSTITFDDPSGHGVCPFADNDIIMCQRVNLNSTTVVKRIVRRVTDVNGKTVTITRDGDLPSDTLTIEKGDDFVRIGNTTNTDRRGGVLITSDLANAPFIEIFDGVSSWSTWGGTAKIKARLGQLSGIVDTDAGLNDDTKFGLYTNDVNLKGHLFSQSGEIAGWDIGSATLSKNNATLSSSGILTLGTGTDIVKLDATDGTYRIWAGHTSAASAPFRVSKTGVLTATGATISGAVTITNPAAVRSTLNVEDGSTGDQTTSEIQITSGWAHGSDTTKIDGGDIYADSVTAGAIAAGTITATQIDTANITSAVVTSTSVNATTINADRILAGTLSASRIAALDMTGKTCTFDTGSFGGWSINSNGMYRGTAVASGLYTSSAAHITIGAGWISANKFRIDSDGTAHFKGTLDSATSGSLSGNTCALNDLNASNVTAAGTMTGSTIRTSASNKRIEMKHSDNTLRFYTDTAEVITIDDTLTTNWDNVSLPGIKITNGVLHLYSAANEFIKLSHDWSEFRGGQTSGGSLGVINVANYATHGAGKTGIKSDMSNSSFAVSSNAFYAYGGRYYAFSNDFVGRNFIATHEYGLQASSGGAKIISGASGRTFTAYAGHSSAACFQAMNEGGTQRFLVNNNGTIYSGATLLHSDENKKKNVESISDCLEKVTQLRPVSFNWKDESQDDGLHFGLIAQEVQPIIPEVVKDWVIPAVEASEPILDSEGAEIQPSIEEEEEKSNGLMLTYSELIPYLIGAVKELKAEVETLKNNA